MAMTVTHTMMRTKEEKGGLIAEANFGVAMVQGSIDQVSPIVTWNHGRSNSK